MSQPNNNNPSRERKRLEREVYANEVFEVATAVRRRIPIISAIWGPQFSGKTYSAIMLAAGLIEPGQLVGMIDTENGRGESYADDPDVRRVLPQGYKIIKLHPPFHPLRYIRATQQLEQMGCAVVITDSGSHAWEGDGGAQDIKEQDKAWNHAKLWTKRYKAALVYSQAHQIVCLRAQEKTKVIGQGERQEYQSLGIQPICEKSFPFDMTVAFEVEGEIDGKTATHLARPKKWTKAMDDLFLNWQPQLLTPAAGRRIREWNNSGATEDPFERLRKDARAAATTGMAAYEKFFKNLTPAQRKSLADVGDHDTNKRTADETDNPPAVDPDPEVDAKFFGDIERVA
jgi:hypothetical protein